jgi:small conductance mechanosensitive channel
MSSKSADLKGRSSISPKNDAPSQLASEIKILNNGEVNTLVNHSKNPSVAVVLFAISYEEDIDRTTEVLKAVFPSFASNMRMFL